MKLFRVWSVGNSGKTIRACLWLLLQLGDTTAQGLTRYRALTHSHKSQQDKLKGLHKLFPIFLSGFTLIFPSCSLEGTGHLKLLVYKGTCCLISPFYMSRIATEEGLLTQPGQQIRITVHWYLCLCSTLIYLDHIDPQSHTVKRALTRIGWPHIKPLYSILCGSSQAAVSHTLSLGLVKHFGDKFPFKILLLFPFISLVWVFSRFWETGNIQSTYLRWSRLSWNTQRLN